jgi:nitrite reductase (NO-forming)
MKAIGCALAIVGLMAIVVVATLGGARFNGSGSGSSGSVDIVLEDLRFVPNRIDATVGVPITVRLTNKGTERHDLNFESIHMPGLGGVESILEPGETRTITLTFDQPGTHTFICTLPGHAAAGMTGAAFVSP